MEIGDSLAAEILKLIAKIDRKRQSHSHHGHPPLMLVRDDLHKPVSGARE